MAYDPNLELVIKGEDGKDDWVDTHHFAPEVKEEAKSVEEPTTVEVSKTVDSDEDDDDAPAVDMDNFLEEDGFEVEDPNCYKPDEVDEVGDDNVVKTRTYDLHITYDKYYQVRRHFC